MIETFFLSLSFGICVCFLNSDNVDTHVLMKIGEKHIELRTTSASESRCKFSGAMMIVEKVSLRQKWKMNQMQMKIYVCWNCIHCP